jgi:hypothetical protein
MARYWNCYILQLAVRLGGFVVHRPQAVDEVVVVPIIVPVVPYRLFVHGFGEILEIGYVVFLCENVDFAVIKERRFSFGIESVSSGVHERD